METLRDIIPSEYKEPAPRFTIIHHPVREKFELSLTAYAIIDSIHQLSHRPDHPWCEMAKDKLADFVGAVRKTVYNAINEGIEKGLLEKNDRGDVRTTNKWIDAVVLYERKKK